MHVTDRQRKLGVKGDCRDLSEMKILDLSFGHGGVGGRGVQAGGRWLSQNGLGARGRFAAAGEGVGCKPRRCFQIFFVKQPSRRRRLGFGSQLRRSEMAGLVPLVNRWPLEGVDARRKGYKEEREDGDAWGGKMWCTERGRRFGKEGGLLLDTSRE